MTASEFSCKYQRWMDFMIFGHPWTFGDNFDLWINLIFNVFLGVFILILPYGTFASVLMILLQSRIAPVACEYCSTYLMEAAMEVTHQSKAEPHVPMIQSPTSSSSSRSSSSLAVSMLWQFSVTIFFMAYCLVPRAKFIGFLVCM